MNGRYPSRAPSNRQAADGLEAAHGPGCNECRLTARGGVIDSGFYVTMMPVGSSEVRVGLGVGGIAMPTDFLPELRPEHPA